MTVPEMFATAHSYYSILLSLQIIAQRPPLLLGQNYLVILRQHDTEEKKKRIWRKIWTGKHIIKNACLSIHKPQTTHCLKRQEHFLHSSGRDYFKMNEKPINDQELLQNTNIKLLMFVLANISTTLEGSTNIKLLILLWAAVLYSWHRDKYDSFYPFC